MAVKDCIGDFVDSWRAHDTVAAATNPRWIGRFRDAGYYHAELRCFDGQTWKDVHEWCKQQYGDRHYSWTGFIFWFETEQDSILFTLRWG
jgi:hypothetical protein